MTGLILLAAGASTRLGRPKQQLVYKGKSLLQHAATTALEAGCSPVIVVLGAHANEIRPGIEGQNVLIVENKGWEEGMGASIRCGINALQQVSPLVDDVIIMLCDQPFVRPLLLKDLVQKKNGKGIVACVYNDTVGAPVLFDRKYFPELKKLKGAEGAKNVVLAHREDVAEVEFPEGKVDIDTEEDWKGLGNKS